MEIKLKGNTFGHLLPVLEKSTHLLACLLQLAEARLERSHRELMEWDPCVLSSPLPPHLEGSWWAETRRSDSSDSAAHEHGQQQQFPRVI